MKGFAKRNIVSFNLVCSVLVPYYRCFEMLGFFVLFKLVKNRDRAWWDLTVGAAHS